MKLLLQVFSNADIIAENYFQYNLYLKRVLNHCYGYLLNRRGKFRQMS